MTRTVWMLGFALVACGNAKKTDKPAVAIDVAPINALVPQPLAAKLVFEKRDITIKRGKSSTTYTMAAPKTWKQEGEMFAHLKADDAGGFFSRLEVGSNCDGECAPKDWAQIADKVNFAPRTKGKVLKDDKGKNRRTMIAEVEMAGVKSTDIVVAWWNDGDKNYHACTATLDDAIKDAAPAFEKACQAVAIDGDD